MSAFPPTPPDSVSDPGDDHSKVHKHAHKQRQSESSTSVGRSEVDMPPLEATSTPNAIMSTLSLPSEYLDKYRQFITKNSSSVSQIESALRSLTYLIPGRFRDAEIASESLHSGIQLLSMYHDSVLFRAASKLPGMPKPAPRDRYTKFWIKESPAYRKVGTFLQVLRTLELWLEMVALRKGEKVRWRVVILLEAMKALCRLALLRITGGRMCLPPLPDRDEIPDAATAELDEEEALAYGQDNLADKDWSMPRTGLVLPSLPGPSEISSYLQSKVLTAEDIKPAMTLLSKIQGSPRFAEILHIVRPVIYAIAMSRSRDKKSWQPWLLGISIELAARQLRKERGGLGNAHSSVKMTALERDEWNRRGWAMGWWLLRGGFYENITKGLIEGFVSSRFVPGLVGGIVDDYAFLWGTYSACSNDC